MKRGKKYIEAAKTDRKRKTSMILAEAVALVKEISNSKV